MSFATLNSPPLITVAGIGIHYVLEPYLNTILPAPIQDSALYTPRSDNGVPLYWYKVANILSFAIQVFAVTRPGRIDGDDASSTTTSNNNRDEKTSHNNDHTRKVKKLTVMDQLSPGKYGKTLVAPSGWAFAIWGPIFLGEFISCTCQLLLLRDDPQSAVSTRTTTTIIKQITVPFVSAQLFQTLWTAAFRPKYAMNNTNYIWNNKMYTSTFLLASTAYSLSKAHSVFTTTMSSSSSSPVVLACTFQEYLMYFLPISLHFGWTCAATLVNLNGTIALVQPQGQEEEEDYNPKKNEKESRIKHAQIVRWVGHVSIGMATIAGIYITWTRNAPVYGGVIAWALSACADGMKTRIKETHDKHKKNDSSGATSTSIGVYGASTQQWLCRYGAYVCSLTSLVVTTLSHLQRNQT